MVVALGPGKFYGSSLPRPYIYTEQKFNAERVDPPMTIMEPFLSWANEAHWSMGGLNYKRLRLQGRIEGNVKKLRSEKEKQHKQRIKRIRDTPQPVQKETVPVSNSPVLAAPVKPITRRKLALVDDVDEEVPVEKEPRTVVRKGDWRPRRGPVRKLGDDFDRIATVKTVEEIEKPVQRTEAAVKMVMVPTTTSKVPWVTQVGLSRLTESFIDRRRHMWSHPVRQSSSQEKFSPSVSKVYKHKILKSYSFSLQSEPFHKARLAKKKKLQKGEKKINSSAVKKSPMLRTSPRLNVVRFED